MNGQQRTQFKKLLQTLLFLVENMDDSNVEAIGSLIGKFEIELRRFVKSEVKSKKTTARARPIWRDFANMTEEDIQKEFSNDKKYPDLDSIKSAVKGFLPMTKVSKVKTRETLIKHIIREYRKREHIKDIGR